ncbi:MAPEG family protein [Pseudahrensia aquimaris]|uniref:MAPEG family protein n=1 Tax=Pseudahrensia aquimaris TaxID=744461 RepID=A0ABW3FHR1_9HYPH
MENLFQAMPQLAAYSPSFVACAVLVLAVIIQGFLTGALALAPGHQLAGRPLKNGQEDRSFRVMRTYANSTENLPMLTLALVLAIVASVPAVAVNWIVGLHVAARLAHWAIYYSGIGKEGEAGPRTIAYVIGLLLNLALAVAALFYLVA